MCRSSSLFVASINIGFVFYQTNRTVRLFTTIIMNKIASLCKNYMQIICVWQYSLVLFETDQTIRLYPAIDTIKGVMPSLLLAFIRAPFCNNNLTTFSCPWCPATINGVKFLCQLLTLRTKKLPYCHAYIVPSCTVNTFYLACKYVDLIESISESLYIFLDCYKNMFDILEQCTWLSCSCWT